MSPIKPRKVNASTAKKAAGGEAVRFKADKATLTRLRWVALAVEFVTGERHSQSTLLRYAVELLAAEMDATLGEHVIRNQKQAVRHWLIRNQGGQRLCWPEMPQTAEGLERVPRLHELDAYAAAERHAEVRRVLHRADRMPFPGETMRRDGDE
jgi:hypothetical protein